MKVTVGRKGQITLPKRIRDLLGLERGSVIEFAQGDDGHLVLVKVRKRARPSRFSRLRGHAGKGLSTDEIMAMTRG